jgi:hypothetical protein
MNQHRFLGPGRPGHWVGRRARGVGDHSGEDSSMRSRCPASSTLPWCCWFERATGDEVEHRGEFAPPSVPSPAWPRRAEVVWTVATLATDTGRHATVWPTLSHREVCVRHSEGRFSHGVQEAHHGRAPAHDG